MSVRKLRLRYTVPILLVHALAWFAAAQGTSPTQSVLIQIHKPYDGAVAAIQAHGGNVTRQFKYIDAIAADIPAGALPFVRSLAGTGAVTRDDDVVAPAALPPGFEHTVRPDPKGPIATAEAKSSNGGSNAKASPPVTPASISLNNRGTNIEAVHAKGYTGDGVIVAVIDSGIRPGFPLLESDGSVIGGEDFVGDGKGFSSPANDGHGTFIAGLISGNAEFNVSGALLDAIRAYAPGALNVAGRLPVIGTAPKSQIYALRYFSANKPGAKLSIVLAAIERVIDLRKSGTLKIEVCNMSFGVSSTTFAGHTFIEQEVEKLYENGIVGIASAGDAGPSSLTIASPSSSISTLSVGGLSFAANDRILRDLTIGPGAGPQYRPSQGTQTFIFSSRGPTADGRIFPHVVTSAVADIGQGYCSSQKTDACSSTISIASGTSFSAPIVSGIAAVLRQAFPQATAYQIRNAIAASASSSLIDDGSTQIDRGGGIPDALAAYNLILNHQAPDGPPVTPLGSNSGADNVQRSVNIDANMFVNAGSSVFRQVHLKPGQRGDVLFSVPLGRGVAINVNNIQSTALNQNPVFGDGVSVDVHSAKTSDIRAVGDYLASALPRALPVQDAAHFDLTNLDTGIVRVTVTGDYVNAGDVTADIHVSLTGNPSPFTPQGAINDKGQVIIPVQIPNRVRLAEFRLIWLNDWSRYPTTDLDLTLVPPGGAQPNLGAATLASPEHVSLTNPTPGTWSAVIDGFSVPAGPEPYELQVFLDGIRVY